MEQNISERLAGKNAMILEGRIVDATAQYFANEAVTTDFDGTSTQGKAEMLAKMEGFAGAIAKVNGITLHYAAAHDNVSFAEFTFDFDMQDGSHILWHEIIRSVWEDGEIVHEQYFKG